MRLLTAGSLVRVQLGEPKEYSLSTVGVDDAGGPPVPIPNTEVKPCSAEDTWLATARENRKMPTSDSEYFFYLDYFKHCKRCFFFFLKMKLPHTILVISIIFGLKIRFFTKLLTDFFAPVMINFCYNK